MYQAKIFWKRMGADKRQNLKNAFIQIEVLAIKHAPFKNAVICRSCSRLLGRLPSDKTPGVSSLGCALVAVRACLLVLLCCVHPTQVSHPIPTISSLSYSRT
jgi:hypothetical protein